MSNETPVDKLVAIADKYSFDTNTQFAISEYTGVGRKAWKHVRDAEAEQVLNVMKDTSPDDLATKATEASTSTEVAESDNVNLSHVLDEETGKLIKVSDDMRRIAHGIQQRIEGATIITAFLIQMVRDEKLYLAFGCGSFQEYADTMLPFTRHTAYKYISIGEKFAPLIPKLESSTVASMQQLDTGDLGQKVNDLSGIGMSKLYELTKIPDADFSEVMNKGVVKTPDGQEWSLEDIKAESSRKLAEEIKQVKKKYQARVANLEEDRKTLLEERDKARETLEKNQARIDRSYEIESKYGEKAVRMEEIEHLLTKSNELLTKLEKSFGQIDIDNEDPDSIKEQALSIMRRISVMQEDARRRFPWISHSDHLKPFNSFLVDVDPSKLGQPVKDSDIDFAELDDDVTEV